MVEAAEGGLGPGVPGVVSHPAHGEACFPPGQIPLCHSFPVTGDRASANHSESLRSNPNTAAPTPQGGWGGKAGAQHPPAGRVARGQLSECT